MCARALLCAFSGRFCVLWMGGLCAARLGTLGGFGFFFFHTHPPQILRGPQGPPRRSGRFEPHTLRGNGCWRTKLPCQREGTPHDVFRRHRAHRLIYAPQRPASTTWWCSTETIDMEEGQRSPLAADVAKHRWSCTLPKWSKKCQFFNLFPTLIGPAAQME
jgi:hypothetical protein